MVSSFPGRAPRVPFDGAVWVGQVGQLPGRLRKLYAANLSRGGMFLRTEDPLPVGQPLMVALDSSEEIVPIANAEVVWQRSAEPDAGEAGDEEPAGIGIRFRDLQPEAAALLASLLGESPDAFERGAASLDDAPEPVTPALTPAELAAEPLTQHGGLPPLELVESEEPPTAETRAFWTGFNLPNRSRVK